MNRIPRGLYGGGFFHVMVQGINKSYILEEEEEKERYYSLLVSKEKKYDVELLAYCIMDNHAHMLIYTEEVYRLSKYMGIVNSTFAKEYNFNKNRVGYVFRDRFNSQYIKAQTYLFKCLNYIHMNPVNAKIVSEKGQYKYSSYNDYINKNGIITNEKLKRLFGKEKNYLEIFKSIDNEEFEVMDLEREEKNFEIAVKLYLSKWEKSKEKIKNNKQELKKFCEEIIYEKNYKQRQVANFLGIKDSYLSKVLKTIEKKDK